MREGTCVANPSARCVPSELEPRGCRRLVHTVVFYQQNLRDLIWETALDSPDMSCTDEELDLSSGKLALGALDGGLGALAQRLIVPPY